MSRLYSLLSSAIVIAGWHRATGQEETCRLWLAPSTLSTPTVTQYGLFAGVEFQEGDIIPDAELAIPYVDFFLDVNKQTAFTRGILDYLESQMWTQDHARAKFEGNHSSSPFVPGVGVLGNYHSLVANTDWLLAGNFLRDREDITVPGKPHLSRGAITPWSNMSLIATQRIPFGAEIHPGFGDMWDKEEPSPYQDKFSRKDIVDADLVVDRIVDFYDRFEDQMTDELKEDILDFMLDKILGAAGGQRAATIRSLIPQNYKKIRKVKEAGGTFLYRNKDFLKTPRWLKKNAVCVDTMYSAKSTIQEAGRGAFASRDIAKGDRITIIPTLLFGKRDLMKMFDIVPTEAPQANGDEQTPPPEGKLKYDSSKPRGAQIGLNYAFGHPESSFLFLPMSPLANFINHNSSPNAVLQWSTHSVMFNDQVTWDYTVEEVMNFRSSMVVFEIEALQDIKKGEEVFIDYQPDWTRAWAEYKQMWQEKHANKPWPLRAEDVLTTFQKKPFPVAGSDGKTSLPSGVLTACYIEGGSVPDGSPAQTEDGTAIQQWVGPVGYKNYMGTSLLLCTLKERHSDGARSHNYTVITRIAETNGQTTTMQTNDVPHAAVTLVDAPYTSDIHFQDAFRHPIGIPDEIYPQNWRDLR